MKTLIIKATFGGHGLRMLNLFLSESKFLIAKILTKFKGLCIMLVSDTQMSELASVHFGCFALFRLCFVRTVKYIL